MENLNIEDMLKNAMGGMSVTNDVKTTPTVQVVTDDQLYCTAKQHLFGLLEQPTLTVGQVALLGPLVSLVSMNSRW